MRAASRADPGDRGAVTVEAAISLTALVLVFAMIAAGLAAVTGQLRCADAAREAARLVARGERGLAEEAVRITAPAGARLVVTDAGDSVAVRVVAEPGDLLPGLELRAEAHAMLEPGVGQEPVPPEEGAAGVGR
ncbi:hypothetical protein CFN78_11255 [Amycolatopsis antarctica]|uniref:Pilus assembly protein TadE n=1 Tax=Amycolatopsis antarctica TaxID=1854586 RepID=A0A263D4I1_9PSEU|nr:TadE family type IV pilus minor pilin [Amycolatopsis antarctica]OZM73404.1 hypothetical protein CFN78_11255 [Amycolatopsis antarctica]